MPASKITAERKANMPKALETLKRCFPQGSTVYTVLRHVSGSGMRRRISVVSLAEGYPVAPNYATAVLLGLPLWHEFNDAVVIDGCGMDMGFEIAYRLGMALYGNGYALKHTWL